MNVLIKLILLGLWGLFSTTACFHDDEPTPVGSCPEAQEYYDYAESLHREAQEKLYFGSTWEISYKSTLYRPAEYHRYPQLVTGPPDDEVFGAREYEGTTGLTFTMPAGPTPVSCEDVLGIKDETGDQADMVYELITLDYYLRFLEIFPYNGIPITGSGTHQSREYPSFATDRVVEFTLLACPFDNPCAQDRTETLGCSVPETMHSVDARIFIDWYPGLDAYISTDIVGFAPEGTNRTQVKRYGKTDYEYIGINPDLCASFRAVCLGTTSYDIPCGVEFQEFDRYFHNAPEIPLQPVQRQDYSETNNYGDVRTRTVSLECVDGCECITVNDCDDGSVCTRDSCNAGNCDNTPDDAIRPEQVDNDCRTCVNGEVFSMRERAERECEVGKSTTVEICSTSDNWIVHWVKEFGGPTEQAHFCQSGMVPGDSELTICNGQGQCPVGSPVTSVEASIDRSCQNYAGQSVQLICNVLCTRCE